MKSKVLILSTFLFAAFCFTSCDTETIGPEETVANYWESNALNQMQLRGPVKKILMDETEYQFNKTGNLISQSYSAVTITYEYQNDVLVRLIENNPYAEQTSDTVLYEYENTGKIIPLGITQLFRRGMTPDLSAVILKYFRTDYDFHGTDLWIIKSLKINDQFKPIDTAIIAYSGNYPLSFNNGTDFFDNISYDNMGMFLTYNEGYISIGQLSTRAFTFIPNDKYMLVSSRTITTVVPEENMNHTITTTYTYNSNFDPITEVTIDVNTYGTYQSTNEDEIEYSDYVYDSNQNWTSRKTRSKLNGNWTNFETQTRTIEYY